MKFTNEDYPRAKRQGSELTDTIEEEHPKGLITVAEQRIKAMHSHDDGTPVELHEMGASEIFLGQSLEGKLGFGSSPGEKATVKAEPDDAWQQILQQQPQQQGSSEKIQYERNKNQNGSLTYGNETAKFDTAAFASQSKKQETLMMGCNCGQEWTVTGAGANSSNPAAGASTVKIEQYGSAAASGSAGYNVSGGSSGPGEYKASGASGQDYKG